MHRHALAIRLKALGEDHPDTAISYNNLAQTLRAQGKYAEAEAMLPPALAIRPQGPGRGPPRHRHRATTTWPYDLDAQGKYAEAEAMHRRALAIDSKALGEDHPDTAMSYNNLAATLRDQGKYAEAEAMLRNALAICRSRWGRRIPTPPGAQQLGLNLHDQGKYAEAESCSPQGPGDRPKRRPRITPRAVRSATHLAATLARPGSLPRPSRCSERRWRSAVGPWARTTPPRPRATAAWPPP